MNIDELQKLIFQFKRQMISEYYYDGKSYFNQKVKLSNNTSISILFVDKILNEIKLNDAIISEEEFKRILKMKVFL